MAGAGDGAGAVVNGLCGPWRRRLPGQPDATAAIYQQHCYADVSRPVQTRIMGIWVG